MKHIKVIMEDGSEVSGEVGDQEYNELLRDMKSVRRLDPSFRVYFLNQIKHPGAIRHILVKKG